MAKKKKRKPVRQKKHTKQIKHTKRTAPKKHAQQPKQGGQNKTKQAQQAGKGSAVKQAAQPKQGSQNKTKQVQQGVQAKQPQQQTGKSSPVEQAAQPRQGDQNKTKQAQQGVQTKQPKQAGKGSSTKQTKQAQKSSPVRQAQQTGKCSPIKQTKQPRHKQPGQAAQKRQPRQHTKGEWKAVLYNCPYVLGIVCTSLLVMCCSDKIGFRSIARDARTVIAQVGVTTEAEAAQDAQNKNTADILANVDTLENNVQETILPEENAGKRKDDIDEKEDENDSQNKGNNLESTENGEDLEKNIKGVTNFESYEPQEIDSRYYSDAGKIALTTEYPYQKEDISYFKDAAFLGDSRTLGISDYAGLEEADFYCDSGMMIFKLLEEAVTYQKTGDKVDLTQVLQEKQYGKIYIMLGMNELGYGNTEMYLEQYRKVLQQIREWQPQAILYVMANLHVSREKNNMETEFNNININDKNAASAQLANGTDIFYLDANPLFTDQEGYLNADLTFDGVHLYAQHYDKWREFLLEHAVEPIQEAQEVEVDSEEVQEIERQE